MRSPEDQCHCHKADTIGGILAPQIEDTTEGTLAPKSEAVVGQGLCCFCTTGQFLSLLHPTSFTPSQDLPLRVTTVASLKQTHLRVCAQGTRSVAVSFE